MSFGKLIQRVDNGFLTGGISEFGKGGIFNPGQTTQDQVPLETPEQRAARQKLLDFANTGTFGNFTAGADIGVRPGDYSMTPYEQSGLSSLQTLLSSGIPDQFKMGNDALASILNPDPNYIQPQFDSFKAQVERQINNSNNDLKRSASYTGNLYSTGAIKNLGDIQARGNETLTAQLASLTDAALNRRAAAIPLAFQAGAAQDNLLTNRINASQTYGALPRTLSNQMTNDVNAEILRKRNEQLLPLNALQTVSGQSSNFGVPSVSVQNPNPFLDLLKALVSAGGTYAGAQAGRA